MDWAFGIYIYIIYILYIIFAIPKIHSQSKLFSIKTDSLEDSWFHLFTSIWGSAQQQCKFCGTKRYSSILLSGGLKHLLYFCPDPWGEMLQVDKSFSNELVQPPHRLILHIGPSTQPTGPSWEPDRTRWVIELGDLRAEKIWIPRWATFKDPYHDITWNPEVVHRDPYHMAH